MGEKLKINRDQQIDFSTLATTHPKLVETDARASQITELDIENTAYGL